MHWPSPDQRHRIAEIRDNLIARIAEAEREGWLGEIEGLKVSLAGASDKLAQIGRRLQADTRSASACPSSPISLPPQGAPMTPTPVTDSLLHDLVASSQAEGTSQFAVAAAITLDDRVLLCGRTTPDFDQEWDLPGGPALPGETLAGALDRTLACDYGLEHRRDSPLSRQP